MSKTSVFRTSDKYLRKMERKKEIAWERYNGKSALLETYEEKGIWNDHVAGLTKRVRLTRTYLKNRGEIV